MKCEYCKKRVDGLPRKCKYCGKVHCSNCLLPENHNCKGLDKVKNKKFFSQKSSKRFSNLNEDFFVSPTDHFGDEEIVQEDFFVSPMYRSDGNDNPKKPKRKTRFKFSNYRFSLESLISYLVLILFVAGFISPIFLFFLSPSMQDMQYVIGNPKPIYIYDIGSSCSEYQSNIVVSSLDHLSKRTGVKFVRLQNPFGLLSGGMSFSCSRAMSNYRVVGEAESGFAGIGWFIIAWNNIRLSDVSREVIIHETLHAMGMGHSSDSTSIMYPYTNGMDIENSLSHFIAKYYTNPLSYLNAIPLNLLLIIFILVAFVFSKNKG